MADAKAEAARILLDAGAVLFNAKEPFTYTSGKKGPVYVDCRRLISFPEARMRLMDLGAEMIKRECAEIGYVAGGESAGIPYAAFLSERLNLPMLYVRKKPKGFGRMAQIEGFMNGAGKNVLLVEDVQNYGTSIKIFIDALRAAGAIVAHAFVIFEHGHESSRALMRELGITLHALSDWKTVLAEARRQNLFDARTLKSVERFLHNPDQWQQAS